METRKLWIECSLCWKKSKGGAEGIAITYEWERKCAAANLGDCSVKVYWYAPHQLQIPHTNQRMKKKITYFNFSGSLSAHDHSHSRFLMLTSWPYRRLSIWSAPTYNIKFRIWSYKVPPVQIAHVTGPVNHKYASWGPQNLHSVINLRAGTHRTVSKHTSGHKWVTSTDKLADPIGGSG